MQLTYLDSNSWLMEISGKRILLDPWLVGDLVFGNLPWLFKGRKNTERQFTGDMKLSAENFINLITRQAQFFHANG